MREMVAHDQDAPVGLRRARLHRGIEPVIGQVERMRRHDAGSVRRDPEACGKLALRGAALGDNKIGLLQGELPQDDGEAGEASCGQSIEMVSSM